MSHRHNRPSDNLLPYADDPDLFIRAANARIRLRRLQRRSTPAAMSTTPGGTPITGVAGSSGGAAPSNDARNQFMTAEQVVQLLNTTLERERGRSPSDVKKAIALSLEKTREPRKLELIAMGLSAADAEIAITESDNRALGNGGNTIVSRPPEQRYNFKPGDIGLFDGNPLKLHSWLQRVQALHNHNPSPAWQDPLLTALPLCMVGAAENWYTHMSDTARAKLINWQGWRESLVDIFAPDLTQVRQMADAREWNVRRELIQTYHYDKVSLLRTAYPGRDDTDHVLSVKLGLPPSLQISVRTNMAKDPTLEKLLVELRQLEGPYRAESPTTRSLLTDDNPYKASPSSSRAKNDDAGKASQSSRSERRPPLASTYVRANIWVDKNGRHYRIPGSNDKISLGNDKCKHCGEKHFDFEHHHLVKSEKDVKFVEGYPVSAYEGHPEDSDNEGFSFADQPSEGRTSPASSRSSMPQSPVSSRSSLGQASSSSATQAASGKALPTSD